MNRLPNKSFFNIKSVSLVKTPVIITIHMFAKVSLTLLCSLLFHYALTSASPRRQKFNRDFITGQLNYYSPSTGSNYVSVDLNSTFPHSLQNPIAVYYTTKNMYKTVYDYFSPTNGLQKSIWYSIRASNYSATKLTTKVTGYLDSPQFNKLGFFYLIVLRNNRIFGSCVTLRNYRFNKTHTSYNISLPSAYTAGDDLRYHTFLRDMRLQIVGRHYTPIVWETSNSLQPNNKVLSKLKVSDYFNDNGNYYSFRFLVLIIDLTQLNRRYSGYQSQSQTTDFSGNSHTFSLPFSFRKDYNTFIGSLSSVSFEYCSNHTYFLFNYYDISGNSNQFGAKCEHNCDFQYSFWLTRYLECDSPQWMYNNSNSLCYDSCATNQYYNFTTYSCNRCAPICPTCYDFVSCRSCDPAHNRVLSNLSCIPKAGYYESGTLVAALCDSNCVTCENVATNCTSCTNRSLLVGGVCHPCSQFWQGCQVCTYVACLSCNSSYHQVNSSYCNLPCTAPHCDVCSNQNTSFCYHCTPTPYRHLINGQCLPICGDAIILDYEICDDGNQNENDGCTAQCTIQAGYNCTTLLLPAGYNYTAYCSYLLPIKFSLLSQEKLEGSNSLRFVLAVDQQQYRQAFWKIYEKYDRWITVSAKHAGVKASFIASWSFDSRLLQQSQMAYNEMAESQLLQSQMSESQMAYNQISDSQLPYSQTAESQVPQSQMAESQMTQAQKSQWRLLQQSELPPRLKGYQSQQLLQLVFQYQQQLHNRSLSLSFDFTRSKDPRVSSIPPSTISLTVVPQNNNYAHLYRPQTYEHHSIAKTMLTLQSITLYVCFVVAIIGKCKRIVAEAIMVAQVCYAGLVTVEWANPLHASVKSLSLLFSPLNFFFSDKYRSFDDPLLPNRLRGLGFYSNFLANFNTALVFLAVPLMAGVVLALLKVAKCFSEEKKEKLSQYSKMCFSEFLLAGVTMTGCTFGCSAVMEFKYGLSDLNQSGVASVVVFGLIAVVFLSLAMMWLKNPYQLFIEYTSILKTKNFLEIFFTLIYSFSGLILALIYFSLYSNKYVTAITMGYALLGILVIIFRPIYAKTRDNIRVEVNLVTVVLTQSAYLLDSLWSDYSYEKVDSLLLKSTLIVPLALGLNLVINISLLVYETVKHFKESRQSEKKQTLQDEQKRYISQKSAQMNKHFKNNFATPVFQTPLLKKEQLWETNTSNYIFKEELNKFLETQIQESKKVLSYSRPATKLAYSITNPKYHEMDMKKTNCDGNQTILERSMEDCETGKKQ